MPWRPDAATVDPFVDTDYPVYCYRGAAAGAIRRTLADVSRLPETVDLIYEDPGGAAFDLPSVVRRRVPVRSTVEQCLRICTGVELLRDRWRLGDSERAWLAGDTQASIDAVVSAMPAEVAPVSTPLESFLPELLAAATEEDVQTAVGLVKGLVAFKEEFIGDLPLVGWDSTKRAEYFFLLSLYREARATTSLTKKLAYINDTFSRRIVPMMSTDVAYFQAVSMLLSYLHLEIPEAKIQIPIRMPITTIFTAADARRIADCERFELKQWFMQSGGEYSGVKLRLWQAVNGEGTPGGVYMVDCMGTNSVSPVRDARLKALGVVTGSMADVDPRGIAATAFEDLEGEIARAIQAMIPRNALVVCTGHSLGATTAHRAFRLLHDLGYDGAYLLGYNGGAFADDIPEDLRRHASTHANYILNEGDPVPFGGRHLLPGTVKRNEIVAGGTIASWNPLFGLEKDPIRHGNAEEVAGMMVGVPGRYSKAHSTQAHAWLMHSINQAFMTWAPAINRRVITGVLKPEPEELIDPQVLSYYSNPEFPENVKRDPGFDRDA